MIRGLVEHYKLLCLGVVKITEELANFCSAYL